MKWSRKPVIILSAMLILGVAGTWVASKPRKAKERIDAELAGIEGDRDTLFAAPESEFKWERFDSTNTPFTDCALEPELVDPTTALFAQGKDENQLLFLTLITRLLIARNFEWTQDCSCVGKSIPWSDVVRTYEALVRQAPDGELVSWEQSDTYARLTPLQIQVQYSYNGGI